MTDLLRAVDVTVQYPKRTTPAVHDASVTIREGEAIGIVGESGSGKSTFARVLVGATPVSAGSVTVEGRAWGDIRRRDARRRSVQMIYQDPYGALNPWLTARQTVSEVIRVWTGATGKRARVEAEDLLNDVGLPSATFDRRPAQLSGGQCQRVGIARALACRPALLIADEPTSSLDVSAQAQVLKLLQRLRRERGLALVFVSHDLSIVRHVTEQTLVMLSGQIVERGRTDEVLTRPRHDYTQRLIGAMTGRGLRAVVSDEPHVEAAPASRAS